MRIGIDCRLISYRRGIGNYLYNLVSKLIELDKQNQYFLYIIKEEKEFTLAANFQWRRLNIYNYVLWEQIALPLAALRDKLDILHCPANGAPIRLSRKIRLILTIHDVMYMLSSNVIPQATSLYQKIGRCYWRWIVPLAAKKAAAIITDSKYSSMDIRRYMDVENDKIRVIFAAPDPNFLVLSDASIFGEIRHRYNLRYPVVLALAGLDPRKNTKRIMRAFGTLSNHLSQKYQLILVGMPLSTQPYFARFARNLKIDENIIFADYIRRQELVALYNMAEIFVYPSLYEGFGMPVLEAMACGAPVITSSVSSLPEIAGEAAFYVNPEDTESIAFAMIKLLSDESLRKEFIAQGFSHIKKYSWEKAAREVMILYEESKA